MKPPRQDPPRTALSATSSRVSAVVASALPRLLYEDPNFKDFWVNPNHFGGAREALAVAKPRQGQFSFMMSDMMGEQWVYHIPAQTFGLMLQNQAMRGENEQRVMGRDPASGTNWVTGWMNPCAPSPCTMAGWWREATFRLPVLILPDGMAGTGGLWVKKGSTGCFVVSLPTTAVWLRAANCVRRAMFPPTPLVGL